MLGACQGLVKFEATAVASDRHGLGTLVANG
jgi:hypothetical protein